MTSPPTAWFTAATPGIDEGRVYSVARWYWPHSTDVEVWDVGSRSWVLTDSFASINVDPKWNEATRDEVQAWIAEQTG